MYGWCLVFADSVSLSVTSVIHEKRLEIGFHQKRQVTSHFEKILKALESTTTTALTPQT